MILGFGEEALVYDGTARRGFIAFRDNGEDTLRLRSEWFPQLDRPIGTSSLASHWFAPKIPVLDRDQTWEAAFSEALSNAIRNHEATVAVNPSRIGTVSTDLENSKEAGEGQHVPLPALTLPGLMKLLEVDTEAKMLESLRRLRWVSTNDPHRQIHAPEAVLTQGWGTDGDLTALAEYWLSRLGYQPKRRTMFLTAAGAEELIVLSGLESLDQVPGLSYLDEKGQERILVIPYMVDHKELRGKVWMRPGGEFQKKSTRDILVEVFLEVIAEDKTLAAQMGSMSSALGGGSGEAAPQWLEVISHYYPTDALSRDAIDLGFTSFPSASGSTLMAWLDGPSGIKTGMPVDTTKFEVLGFKVQFSGNDHLSHGYTLGNGESLEDMFITYGLALPDLPEASASILEKAAQDVRKSAETASDLSALKWYGRSIINRFIAGQTRYEEEAAQMLELNIGRTNAYRIIAVTTHRHNQKLRTGIDLLQTVNDVHSGEWQAETGFKAVSGMLATSLEAEALPGDGLGLFEIWSKLPKGTDYVLLSPREREGAEDAFRDAGMPQDVIRRLMALEWDTFVLIPDRPARINGRDRWAWLQMKENGETIGVLDTGARGAMVEVDVTKLVSDGNQFIVGKLIGVSSAIWSVSAFSLILDNYDDIIKAAKAYALGIKDCFAIKRGGVSYGMGGLPKISGSSGGIKGTFSPGKLTLTPDLGFGSGYQAGVEYYFSK